MYASSSCNRNNSSSNSSLTNFCSTTPRRLFLCDVPLLCSSTQQIDTNGMSNASSNFVRLMGTVVEIIPQPTDINNNMSNTQYQHDISSKLSNSQSLIHFVIDDGTGSIGVFTNRRMGSNNVGSGNGIKSSGGNSFTNIHLSQNNYSTQQQQNLHFQRANQSQPTSFLKSILSTPLPPILVGQTVDCIGRIQTENDGMANVGNNENMGPSSQMLWLAASSVSIVNNPQASTLRLMELSSSDRNANIYNGNNNKDRGGNVNLARGNNNPKNRILVGGHLEKKLNPLYHCNKQGSVVFNMEYAFNYIKHSKVDGGITIKELSLLVGAVEPSSLLAVNLAVEQLREDCRIYQNQGKWFPM